MKVFLSIPNTNWIHHELTIKLPRWLIETKHEIHFESSNVKPVESNRNGIVQRFLKSDCDYLLQIDSDVVPPKNPIDLVDLNLDIVSAPCWIYQHKLILNIYKLDETDGMLVPVDPIKEKGLIEIDSTGTGILLTSRRVLETIKAPFERKYDENGIEELGQDLYFSRKAKEAGFRIFSHLDYISKHYKEINLGILQKVDILNSKDIGPEQRGNILWH